MVPRLRSWVIFFFVVHLRAAKKTNLFPQAIRVVHRRGLFILAFEKK